MTIRTWGVWLPAALGFAACHGGAGKAIPDGGTQTAGPRNAITGPPGTPGTSWGPGASQVAVTMQNTGRNGDTVLFTLQGVDPVAQTTEAHVQLLDASGTPVIAFDTNWDGVADSAENRIHFDQSTLGQKTFAQTITMPHVFGYYPSIASAVVSLSDVNGITSPSVTAALLPQPVDSMGAACDVNDVTDRCAPGLGCGGKPATCQPGVAPTLTTVAYFGGSSPTQLFVGSDPDEDLASITVAFLDGTGKPTTIDLSGDNDLANSIVINAKGVAGRTFFYENDPAPRFTTMVPKISATPTDTSGLSGTPIVATIAPLPLRGNGQSCDAQGFTACMPGFACSPGVVGANNLCGGIPRLQSAACAAAPLTATSGVLAAWGTNRGVSLWDPPAGCAPPTSVGHPESIIALRLTHSVSSLTVSTAMPETDFDTILYVLPGCPMPSAQALGCNDNTQGYTSTVTLTNVAAGTYAIVVDSANPEGGHFGLAVTTN